ncbi:FAD-dependent oxidoreductase [Planctomicrobium sp. SH527]|uniref:FAD-dependent oxidoreductase n=1 Tax=Planctomicrobium sp. SH527 TaxID=3448123 RepID=UPI003F5B8B7B
MSSLKALFSVGLCLSWWATAAAAAQVPQTYDIVVYGGTSAGVIAAVQAKKMNKTVIIVGPDIHLGGLTAGGLGYTDSGKKEAIGGLSRDFYHRLWKHYQQDSAWKWEPKKVLKSQGPEEKAAGQPQGMWIFEPHVAEKVYEELVKEFEIPVIRNEYLNRESGVKTQDGRITSITMLSGKAFNGKMFIDATYEGDLMAAAGVKYHVGREANSVYGETLNGVQTKGRQHAHHFLMNISPYKVPGDPSSGLLPRISNEPPGEHGSGDHRIQAYCFRMCLTNHPENRLPFPKPEGYDASQYQLLARILDSGWRNGLKKFDPIPNKKTDTNNHGPFSTDNIGYNYDYPEGSYERRREIIQEHITYQQGMLYFLANDPSVPEDVRKQFTEWGLAKDEFPDHKGWPHQIYVRESRRLLGEYVMTEKDCQDLVETPKSIGMGSYSMDSHNTQRYVTAEGFVQNEGDVQERAKRPYEISYGSITPKRDECQNLLVPVCVSSSHIAYGSIRMEPVFMILGQSATTAAVIAMENKLAVQDVPYESLRARLLQDGQVLELVNQNDELRKKLTGVVVDDLDAKFTGTWNDSGSISPHFGDGYRHDTNMNKGSCTALFEAALPPGQYEVRFAYAATAGSRATNVPVKIRHAGGETTVKVNQTKQPPMGEFDLSLGVFTFDKTGSVLISNEGTDNIVVVDTIRFVPVKN